MFDGAEFVLRWVRYLAIAVISALVGVVGAAVLSAQPNLIYDILVRHATLTGDLTLSGGDLAITGDQTITGDVTVTGAYAYASQSVTVNGATTFAITSGYVILACTGPESIDTITGGVTGQILVIEHTDTDCTINDDDVTTAADAVDLTGAATNDVGAQAKFITLFYDGSNWLQISESEN